MSATITPHDTGFNPNLPQSLRPLLERIRRDVTALRRPGSPPVWTREPLTLERLNAHLAGVAYRGVGFIDAGSSTTAAAVLDLDDHDGSLGWDEVARTATTLLDALLDHDLIGVPFRSSGGKGVHIWLLWEQTQDAYSVRKLLEQVLGACWLSVGTGGLTKEQVEVFPKQDRVDADGFGNMVILPYAGGTASCALMRLGTELHPMDAAYPLSFSFSDPVPVLEPPVRATLRDPATLSDDVMSLTELKSLLASIDNDNDGLEYDRWRDVIFAIHHETQGSGEGLELAQEWSARSAKHDPDFLEHHVWPYVKSTRGQVITGGTLRMLAARGGWSPPAELEFDDLGPLTTEELMGKKPVGLNGHAHPLSVATTAHPVNTVNAVNAVLTEDEADAVAYAELDDLNEINEINEINATDAAHPAPSALSIEKEWLDQIEQCLDPEQLRGMLAEGIRHDRRLETADGALTRDLLAGAWAERLSTLTGRRVGINHARKALTPARRRGRTGELDCPTWMAGWLYVQQDDVMFHETRKVALSTKAFNLSFAHEVRDIKVPGRQDNSDVTPLYLATALVNVDKVARVLYMPRCADRFAMNGSEYVNSYDPRTLPDVPDSLDDAGLAAVAVVQGHLEWLIDNPFERALLLDWIAWQVQRPGEKVRWAPLVCGQEGDGKSALADLLRAVCGIGNVRVISTRQLESAFTGWAHGAAVGVIEEIYIPGHNRHEVVNALKPYITNDEVEIHPKGRDPYNTPNTMNYMAFTNYEDAIPLEEGSRRYLALRTRYRMPADLKKAMEANPDHFDRYYDVLEEHGGDLRRWLLDHQFGVHFLPSKPAPVTEHLQRMITLSVSDDAIAVEDVIDSDNAEFVGRCVLSTHYLVLAVKRRHGLALKTRGLARTLSSMGWRPLNEVLQKGSNKVSYKGKVHRVWVNVGAMTTEEERAFGDDFRVFLDSYFEGLERREEGLEEMF